MEKESFEKLIADKPSSVKIKGITLFNAFTATQKAYRDEPTTAHMRDWQTAESAFNEFVEMISGGGGSFSDLAQVMAYLKKDGWAVAKSSLYRHFSQGKIPVREGMFLRADVDRYAKAWLKRKETGKRVQEETEDLHRQKLEKELKRLDIEINQRQLIYDRESGRLMSREKMEIELAGRAIVLESGLKHLIHTSAMEWIRLVDGDAGKEGELIHHVTLALDEHLNRYSQPIDYRIVIDEHAVDPEEMENG